MDRVQFICPQCQKPMVVDGKYAGLSVACPGCLKSVMVPLSAPVFVPPEEVGPPKSPDGLPYKRCPYCTEYVSPHVTKCSHCGHRLDVEGPSTMWRLRNTGPRTSLYAILAAAFCLPPGLCVLGYLCGLVALSGSLLLAGIASCVLGIFCGHVALRKIRRSSILYKGEALADWGLGLSYLLAVLYLGASIWWLLS